MKSLIRKYENVHITDGAVVGGKNASLGEMMTSLTSVGIKVPDGFATTVEAFRKVSHSATVFTDSTTPL